MRLLITDTSWPMMAAAHDLDAAGFRLSRVEDAESLFDFVRHGQQDAVLVAAPLPDAEADRVVARVRAAAPRLPVVALAEPGLDWPARRALYAAGVDAVLDLPMPAAEFAARLRAMIMGAAGFHSGRLCAGGLELDPASRTACAGRRRLRLPGEGADGPKRIALSPREYDVLELLMLAGGRTVARDEVMDRLYGFEDEPGARIVDVYVARIRAKLAAAGLSPGLVESQRARGLRFAAAPETPAEEPRGQPVAAPVGASCDRTDAEVAAAGPIAA
ncbi:DNA-binding response regulator [Rhodovulum sp. 12E13]|uniref:winged helix-turn-helix transcriptional regulator n=1 Tax=Rhodovulum sp. 12E13 TaxID=2203891 RepID=UPI000E182B81|nr:response regulator transcription factor [Rhodovulum sp. 12E13]RDC71765.1 DNA-binding response regulator [Rhodovulum sp. 12E13]